MKQKVDFFIVRLNDKIESITPLNEIYDHVQIHLDKEHLTEEDVLTYYSHMARSYQLRRLADVLETGYLQDEQEAKDINCKLSEYSFGIESKEIDFE